MYHFLIAGQTLAECFIKVIDDEVTEDTEAFNVFLSSPEGAVLGDMIEAKVIIDEDLQCRLSTMFHFNTPEADLKILALISWCKGKVLDASFPINLKASYLNYLPIESYRACKDHFLKTV